MGARIVHTCHGVKDSRNGKGRRHTRCSACMIGLQEKCCPYWPSEHSEKYGELVLEPIAEYNMPQYVLREFRMTEARVRSID